MNFAKTIRLKSTFAMVLLPAIIACSGGGGGGDSVSNNSTPVAGQLPDASASPSLPTASSPSSLPAAPLSSSLPTAPSPSSLPVAPLSPSLPTAPLKVSSAAEIDVPTSFSFATERTLRIAANLSALDAHRGFLSVCTDFEVSADAATIVNYDSCLLRTWVDLNGYMQDVPVTHDVISLVAAVWYPDLRSVDYAVWQRDSGMQWSITDAN